MSIKVLIVTNMWPNKLTPWLGTFVQTQVKSLEDLGVITSVHNIKSRKSGGNNLNYIKSFFSLLLNIITHKYTCIHLHHWICWLLLVPCFWVKKVYTVHEGEFFLGGFRRFFIELAIKHSQKVIFVNLHMYNLYKEKYIHRCTDFYFIPCGVDESTFVKHDKTAARSDLGLDLSDKYLFFPACRARKEKNASFLESWIAKYNTEETSRIRVIWGGEIPHELMPVWMSACDCVMTLGDYESDGMVVKEAISCGTPVISFNVGNSCLYINSPTSGFIIDRDLEKLNIAINSILSFDEKCNITLDPEYSLIHVSHKILNIYNSL